MFAVLKPFLFMLFYQLGDGLVDLGPALLCRNVSNLGPDGFPPLRSFVRSGRFWPGGDKGRDSVLYAGMAHAEPWWSFSWRAVWPPRAGLHLDNLQRRDEDGGAVVEDGIVAILGFFLSFLCPVRRRKFHQFVALRRLTRAHPQLGHLLVQVVEGSVVVGAGGRPRGQRVVPFPFTPLAPPGALVLWDAHAPPFLHRFVPPYHSIPGHFVTAHCLGHFEVPLPIFPADLMGWNVPVACMVIEVFDQLVVNVLFELSVRKELVAKAANGYKRLPMGQ